MYSIRDYYIYNYVPAGGIDTTIESKCIMPSS